MRSSSADQVAIYAQGACRARRGRGGWAAVLYQGEQRSILSGNDRSTTSDRMELTAIIKGLEAAPRGASIVVNTGNLYIVNAMTKGEERTANPDLWQRLQSLAHPEQVRWWWVKYGRREPGYEIAEKVANMEAGLFETRDAGPVRRRPPQPANRPPGKSRTAGPKRGGTATHRSRRRRT